MTAKTRSPQTIAKRELALFLGLFFCGFVLLPIAIFIVGQKVFGSYAGAGFGDFFGGLSGRLFAGEFYTWLLVLSPYIAWQTLRLMALGWRLTAAPGKRHPATTGKS